ncbi:MAG: 3-hydroxyacyl-CoA dehydrogenase NAD-binding domain-containing protein [Ottowia sp.]|uniref:3-hydroxyacyl-CoA dehydrogenase NAD-binding domain-containing protein n=1 Tax=Ottowia sp. TaxID=1898956 RepID=UPI003C719515
MNSPVTLTLHDDIGVLLIDAPPVNALSLALVEQLRQRLREFAAMPKMRALVIGTAGRTFVAGADAREFSAPDFSHLSFGALMNEVEAQSRPVVAALHGSVLGAGMELALACHARVALTNTRLGLPEVLLGVLAGAGGTQRLPRLVPAELALEMMLSGQPISAASARDAGLVDVVIESGDIVQAAISHARQLADAGAAPRRTRDLTPRQPASGEVLSKAMNDARARRASYPAPQRIVRCVEAALQLPFDDGLAVESRLFDECRRSTESAALRHLFFAQREAARIPGLSAETAPRPIQKVGVVGSGTMGGGIAMNFANAGIPTRIVDSNAQALERGMARIRANYEATAAKGKLTQAQVEERMALLVPSLQLTDLADCDLVIEAVFENLDIKRQVCAELGAICKPGAVIGSNTSTLDIDDLAEASGRPSDFLGLHFFSPANVMKLLEVVRGAKTQADVLATAMHVAKRIGKVAVVSGVCYGFIGNRMLESYLREADFLLMEGATPAQIDRAIEAQGLVMGPCRMLDMAGTDVAGKIVQERGKAGALPEDASYRAVVVRLLESGRHGQKTGSGYYRYEGRKPEDDPEFQAMCAELAAAHGISRRTSISDEEIVQRCLYPLINEGALIVEEGIAYRASDVDVVWTQGYGFPDYRGGPLFMADQIGLSSLCEALDGYAATRGNAFGYWSVSPLLRRLAGQGGRLANQPGGSASL